MAMMRKSVDGGKVEVMLFDKDERQCTLKEDEYMAKGTVIELFNVRYEIDCKQLFSMAIK
jgi:hypothetical protein